MKDGKQLYRDTYLIRFFPFEVGDILKFDDSYIFVEKISKNNIHLYLLETNERIIKEADDLNRAVFVGNDELRKEMIVVNQKDDEIQVMDQKTYKISILKKPMDNISTDTVFVLVIDDEHLYLYPSQNQK